jgi:hypothetical protein
VGGAGGGMGGVGGAKGGGRGGKERVYGVSINKMLKFLQLL